MARKTYIWHVEVGGNERELEFRPMTFFKQAELFIDGERAGLDVSKAVFEGIDQPVLTGGDREIRLVSKGKFTDLAVDGVYLGSGEPYEPLPKMSKVNWVFVILSLCAAFLGGVIPALCAFGGAALGAAAAVKKGLSNKLRIFLGAVLMAVTWTAAIVLSLIFVWGIKQADKNTKKTLGNDVYSITVVGSFENDEDGDEAIDKGFDKIFAVYSDDVYMFAQSISASKLELVHGLSPKTAEDYLKAVFRLGSANIPNTASGVAYTVLDGENYTYVISAVFKDGVFYHTEMFCLKEAREEMIPKMTEWTDTITIKDAGGE